MILIVPPSTCIVTDNIEATVAFIVLLNEALDCSQYYSGYIAGVMEIICLYNGRDHTGTDWDTPACLDFFRSCTTQNGV